MDADGMPCRSSLDARSRPTRTGNRRARTAGKASTGQGPGCMSPDLPPQTRRRAAQGRRLVDRRNDLATGRNSRVRTAHLVARDQAGCIWGFVPGMRTRWPGSPRNCFQSGYLHTQIDRTTCDTLAQPVCKPANELTDARLQRAITGNVRQPRKRRARPAERCPVQEAVKPLQGRNPKGVAEMEHARQAGKVRREEEPLQQR